MNNNLCEKEFRENVDTFKQISQEYRRQLTAISLTIIAAVYVFTEKNIGNVLFLKYSLLAFFLTIFIEILSNFLKSQHYAAWIDNKITTIDYRSSICGKISEVLFWIHLVPFSIGCIFFVCAIF